MANLILAVAIVAGAFAWHHRGFRVPRVLERLGVPPRRMVILAGALIAVLTVLSTIGDIVGGYTAVNLSPGQHVHRSHEPRVYWLQILLQIGVGAGTGVCLIALARSARRKEGRPHDEGRA